MLCADFIAVQNIGNIPIEFVKKQGVSLVYHHGEAVDIINTLVLYLIIAKQNSAYG